MFHRQFPNRRITKKVLSQVMRDAGLTKKKVVITNAPRNAYKGQYDEQILALDEKITEVIQQKGHLLWLDEATFTSRSM